MNRNAQLIAQVVRAVLRLTRGRISLRLTLLLVGLIVAILFLQPYLNLQPELGPSFPPVTAELPKADADVSSDNSRASSQPEASPTRSSDPTDKLASFLKETRRDVFQSPAGLLYTPGSQHGHRVKHVLAHAQDQPNRPGQHGVFEQEDPLALFQLIDDAYQQATTGRQTKTKLEEGRTIYTVNLDRSIGYIGGESGNRRGRPQAKHLRLILQGKKVITAYPYRP